MKFRSLILLFVLITAVNDMAGQNPVQVIKGVIRDADSQITLPGATIVILGTNPVIGTVSDAEGHFKLTGIRVGRYNLQISFIGYEPVVISEVLVIGGKETELQISLKESATALQQVEIKANSNKDKPVNPMAMISSRQLTMEEASRYAGGIDDPSRLASSFAGVAGSLSSNAIVIRGNAPKGLLWRMEGVEIPNPSHFANVSTFGGGGITALSSQMLTNSDFYTGAFPAEFGNALSGVFDMKVRTGNNEKREHTVKAGIIGLDFATEGPFIKGRPSSYLVNYRYSTLALISPLLPENAQGLVYQDLSFKMNFPTKKAGIFSIWGLLSADKTGSEIVSDSTKREYYQDIEEDKNVNKMGAVGLNNRFILSEKTFINTSLSATGNFMSWKRKRLDENLTLQPKDDLVQNDGKYSLSFLVNHKFSSKHTNRTGFIINRLVYDLSIKQEEVQYADEKGSSELIQVYSQSRLDLHPKITANMGFHMQYFTFNDDLSVEPRVSLKLKTSDNSSLSLAYGLHSRLEPIGFYFATHESESGQITQPNKNLKLSRAHHLVLAFEIATGKFSRLKLEPFYQKLDNVPVIPGTSFSMMNLETDWFFNDSLANNGTGRNIGLDITLERFLNSGYYYLITASLFDSRYTGGDNIERNARFNKNYVFNFLFGKEWILGSDKNNVLGINGKFSVLGGDRITPTDVLLSQSKRDVVYNESRAFEERKPDVYYLDFSFSFKKSKARHSSTWSFQFVNLLFQKEFYGHRYNLKTQSVEPHKEIVVIPNLSYRLDF